MTLVPRLFDLVANHQHGDTMGSQIADDMIDPGFVCDIHPHGWAIEDQQLRRDRQPFGDRNALGITTGEGIHRQMRIRRLNGQRVDHSCDQLLSFTITQ